MELEYFRKDRQEHIRNLIRPILDKNRVVITDRYVDSTLAFQTHSTEEANRLYEILLPETLVPDVSFILKCPVELGLARVVARDGENISEFEKSSILETAKVIFESRTASNYEYLDATKDIEFTFSQAIDALIKRFPEIENSLQLESA